MLDERWPETESGTVVRNYFHSRGAAREMRLAQEHGWQVREVTLNGEPIPENPPRKWLRLPPTRLVRDANGKVQLRTSRSESTVWGHTGAKGYDIEVTYVR